MQKYRYKPSKLSGAISIAIGVGMLGFGFYSIPKAKGGALAFLIFWCVMVVAITVANAWAAFSSRGSMGMFTLTGVRDKDNDADS